MGNQILLMKSLFRSRYLRSSLCIGIFAIMSSCSIYNYKNDKVINLVFEDDFDKDSVVLFLNGKKVVDEILTTDDIIGKAKGFSVRYKRNNTISCIVNKKTHKHSFKKLKGDNYLFIQKYEDTLIFTLQKKPGAYL